MRKLLIHGVLLLCGLLVAGEALQVTQIGDVLRQRDRVDCALRESKRRVQVTHEQQGPA